jgi:hypothetical protein
MEPKVYIYVIELQSALGAWEIQGEAFFNREEASRRVDELTAEFTWGLADSEELAALYPDFDWGEAVDYDRFLAAVRESPEGVHAWAESYKTGGMYSYEKVSLHGNAPEPE